MKIIKYLILLLILFIFVSAGSCRRDSTPRLIQRSCMVKGLHESVTCGSFEVLENRDNPDGRKIRLNFVILPATGDTPAADPIFLLQGGPGVAASDVPAYTAGEYRKLRRERDIVLLDQRGTGGSNPLPCMPIGDFDSVQTHLRDMFPEDYVTRCRRELESNADLRYYGTSIAADDMDELREALGYRQINIIGISYGTRLGIIYMKRYPQRVRSIYFHATLMPEDVYPSHLARDTESALERLFADCAADPQCAADYPNLRQDFASVLERLENGPKTVTVHNPFTNEEETVSFTLGAFTMFIRQLMYSNWNSRWIPLLIHWAARDNYSPMVVAAAEDMRSADQYLYFGMFLCVTCTDDIPFIDFAAAREEAGGTFMGTYRLDQ